MDNTCPADRERELLRRFALEAHANSRAAGTLPPQQRKSMSWHYLDWQLRLVSNGRNAAAEEAENSSPGAVFLCSLCVRLAVLPDLEIFSS